ncbi:MAG: hypothetical protein J1E00_06705 [Oscillospiraceae bacterium]|nr:hypothetical protein [Oscillospiraceae bacterium]
MTECIVSTVVAAEGASEVFFTSISEDTVREECFAKLTGAKDPVEIIVFSVSGDLTVTPLKGDGPAAAAGRTYKVHSGFAKCVTVSSGEVLRSDGTIHFVLEAEKEFSDLNPVVAIVQHKDVHTH